MLYFVSNILLFTVSIYSLYYIIKSFIVNSVNGYSFFLPVFLIFYVGPILLDKLSGLGFNPAYRYVVEAIEDETVSLFYNYYISILLIFFIWHSNKLITKGVKGYIKRDNQTDVVISKFIKFYNKYFNLIFLVLVFPILLVFIIGDLGYYSSYNDRKNAFNDLPEAHSLIVKFILLGVVLIAFLITCIILEKKYKNKDRTFLIPVLVIVLAIYFWIHGKRSIVANYLIIQYSFFIISKAISSKNIIRQLIIAIIGFIFFLIGYGKNIADEAFRTYWGLRLDFSRDYGLKFVINNDLLLNRHILPFDFASFLFNIFFYIPRTIWEAKPQPYAVYFTNSAFGDFGNDELYGWGLTTSIFSEHISNIGWIGLITAPLFIYFIFEYENKSTNPLFKLLSILIAILLIVLQPISFMVLILLYLVILIKGDKKYVFR
ncbi:hypothetical protein PZ892_16630 [Sphingobacterium sp. WM]|uniref:hypothetical protein n=1 Tax=Sphingobacterium sp. WM TaxID=3031802 RepID=UPI00240DFDBE|nr:hypothetical protein [Sphingobacterium sp. WM]WFB63285.1 hypothetical protein PZ892_16630 [Sphingobacterium sp. WM]